MRVLHFPFFSSVVLLADPGLSLGDQDSHRLLQDQVIRTDLIRLIPFEVQMAMEDATSVEDSKVITETLYGEGNLLTDAITDWMTDSFDTKTIADQSMINNFTSFDSIGLELVDDSTSKGSIDGQELTLIQLNFEGITLWERRGTGTPPVEAEVVELIQRATFLDDRSLKAALETTINNLLFDLGVDSVDGVQPITIVDVRAYITPPGSISNQDSNGGQGGASAGDGSTSNPNRNLEIIIIVAIVVACLAFALLIFAVVWAWRSDRKDRDDKPSSSTSRTQRKRSNDSKSTKPRSVRNMNQDMEAVHTAPRPASEKRLGKGTVSQQAPEEAASSVDPGSSYDLPNNPSDGSYPRVIGNTNPNGTDDSAADYPDDSVISEDVSSSLSAYYKSGMAYSGSKAGSGGRPPNNFNDAASMSSMDSYGYSLDGYAPSLGPAQGGYPVGPLQAARDAPIPLGTDSDTFKQLQEDESVADYESSMPVAEA
eukprot:CAMPEP_0197174642 /NCGR_PEP_ID=MMETSP1423-20130617/1067_1 /TAXON_ID=476441 /ORGANISM="Pseudo-nitzschia heimii, Strain UNC1101" /LENGTH=482 /DNA_ID=CAMNT_0042623585 /DNA_START=324 /DNA_END=1772 /DNA_ORIENTATION=+